LRFAIARPAMKNVAVRLLMMLSALGCPVVAGCAASVEPIDVMSECPEMPLRGPQEFSSAAADAVIDDFESGDLKLTPIAGRTGSWVGVATMGAQVFGESSSRCVARGTRSGHLTSTTLTPNYPVNWNAVMIDPFSEAHGWDASAYTGFSFWIAAGVNAKAPVETPIGVTTTDTVAGGGVCSVCGDYYAIPATRRIPLTRNWTRWVIKFSDLAQYGFGMPQVPLNKSKLVSIMIWPQAQFDIWIDDVRFER
jgi:hypothetical protein